MKMLKPFTDHPASVGESYFEHLGMAFSFGGRMLFGGVACILHGVFPFLFTKTGSGMISELHDCMVANRVKAENRAKVGGAIQAAE